MLAHTNDDEGTGKYAKMVELVKNHLINLQHTHTHNNYNNFRVLRGKSNC